MELLATHDPHTAENMLPVTLSVMEQVKDSGGVCGTVCTDNARNMERMRRDLRAKQLEELNQVAAACGNGPAGHDATLVSKLENLRAHTSSCKERRGKDKGNLPPPTPLSFGNGSARNTGRGPFVEFGCSRCQ